MEIRRGEIYWVELVSNIKSAQDGKRPCIMSDNDAANKFSPVVHVVPLTTQKKHKKLPVHVEVGVDCGIQEDSIALVEQETLINKSQIKDKIGRCTKKVMRDIERATLIQKGHIKPFVDTKYLKELSNKIKYIDEFIMECQYEGKDYNDELIEKSFVIAEIIGYCKSHNVDFNRYIPKSNNNERRMELREVL